jgi:hypothetical protein
LSIGLAFIFFLLSLICSSVNELLAGFLKLRARDLERGIHNLICDPDIANQLLNHPIIQGMGNTRAETPPVKLGAGAGAAKNGLNGRQGFAGKPSYIPSRAFVAALIDTLVPGSGQDATGGDLLQQARQLAGDTDRPTTDLTPKEKLGRALLALGPRMINGRHVLLSVDDLKHMVIRINDPSFDAETKTGIASAKTIDEIRLLVAFLPSSDAREAILGAIAEGQAALIGFREDAEAWFDDAMERVSGVYKRRTQWWLLTIATAITLLVGADSLRLYDALATNPSLRAALIAQIERESVEGGLLDQPPPTSIPATEPTPQLEATQTDAAPSPTPTDNAAGGSTSDDQDNSLSSTDLLDQLHETSLPFGYDDRPRAADNSSNDWFFWAVKKIAGLAITTFAVALGAPFWFDVLKRVANLRAAGPVPPTGEKRSTSMV